VLLLYLRGEYFETAWAKAHPTRLYVDEYFKNKIFAYNIRFIGLKTQKMKIF
jgi:hypothetical protein